MSASCSHVRRFATTSTSPPSSHSTTSPPSSPASPFTPPPVIVPPNPHLTATELSAEQLDAILRTEQRRRDTVNSKQQHLQQLLQELQHETAHDEARAALTRYQRLVAWLTNQQRGVKLLAVVLAIASLASSMQLLVATDRTQLATSAARQHSDDRHHTHATQEAAVDGVGRRLVEHLAQRIATAGGSDEREWLEALQGQVAELQTAAVCSAEEMRARQAVQSLERDINACYEANKRKPWW